MSMKFGMMGGLSGVAGRKRFWVIWAHFFREHKFLIADISDTSCRIATKFCMVIGLANGHLLPEFGKL